MTPEEFIVYVDNLPDACIEKRTAEEVIFHLPKKKYTFRCADRSILVLINIANRC